MMTHRIFVSSVMRDFSAERAAVKEAILSLRQQPVMAEDFGAQPFSSQTACMEGVRTSDVYLGIYGNRYGFVAQSGLSATEEEFQEARRRGVPILCFEQEGQKEPQQATFLGRIKSYEQGYAFAFFKTPEELKIKVVQALYDLIGHPGVSSLDATGAAEHLDRYQWGSLPRQSQVWLGTVLFPARQGEDYLDVLDLGRRSFQDQLLQPTLFGATAFFQQELGVQRREGASSLAFQQELPRRGLGTSVEAHTDGTLVFGAALPRDERRGHSLVRNYVVDEEEVQRLLTQFLLYAQQFYARLPRSAVVSKLYLATSLTGVGQRAFGKIPSPEPSGMTIPQHRLEDPLRVPSPPFPVTQADLVEAPRLAQQLTALIGRAFRVAGAYYPR